MRLARLTAVAIAAFVVAPAAHAAGPKNLKPFLLRVDEPAATTFSRTPSFSWSPVRGAKTYEFELSTSPKFGEGQIVWTNDNGKRPGAAANIEGFKFGPAIASAFAAVVILLLWLYLTNVAMLLGAVAQVFEPTTAAVSRDSTTCWRAPLP